MREKILFFTDTAELCLFDPMCLKHKLEDAADWWTVSSKAIEEMNAGNVMFIDLGTDGQYSIDVHLGSLKNNISENVLSIINCPSGALFIGPGEETTGEGCEPDSDIGGKLISLESGVYLATVAMIKPFTLEVGLEKVDKNPENDHKKLLRFQTW